jgi:NAD(P)-dependent dehydrogenase (short-subunit alcohol dehydrogenase family)
VIREEDVKNAIEKIIQTFGQLDYAFNNAGIEGKTVITAEYPVEEWNRVIATNLTGVFLCMKYEIPQMLEQL